MRFIHVYTDCFIIAVSGCSWKGQVEHHPLDFSHLCLIIILFWKQTVTLYVSKDASAAPDPKLCIITTSGTALLLFRFAPVFYFSSDLRAVWYFNKCLKSIHYIWLHKKMQCLLGCRCFNLIFIINPGNVNIQSHSLKRSGDFKGIFVWIAEPLHGFAIQPPALGLC